MLGTLAKYKKFDLLIFEEAILALELKPKMDNRPGAFGRMRSVEVGKERHFVKLFHMKDLDAVLVQKRGKDTVMIARHSMSILS